MPPAPEMPDFASYAPEPPAEPSFSTSFEEVPPAAPEEEKGFYPAASNGRDNFSYESYAQQDAEFDAAGEMAPDQPTDGGAAMGAEAPAQDDAAMFGEWESAAPARGAGCGRNRAGTDKGIRSRRQDGLAAAHFVPARPYRASC